MRPREWHYSSDIEGSAFVQRLLLSDQTSCSALQLAQLLLYCFRADGDCMGELCPLLSEIIHPHFRGGNWSGAQQSSDEEAALILRHLEQFSIGVETRHTPEEVSYHGGLEVQLLSQRGPLVSPDSSPTRARKEMALGGVWKRLVAH